MLSVSLRRMALTVVALALSNAAVAAPTIPPAVGHYEAQNARWAKAPGFAARGEALHYSPTSHEPTIEKSYMGTSFFPSVPMQIDDLEQLQIDFFLPIGQSCLVGKLEATIVMNDANGLPRYVYGTLPMSMACMLGNWKTANFVADATWTHGGLAAAHTAVANDLGDAYEIAIIRISYTAGTNTEAWFDLERINSLPFAERVEDLSTNALLPDAAVPGLDLLAGTALGYFQTKNMRWGVPPKGPLHGEAMHYSPWSHEASGSNFAATSFFPQTALTLRDIAAMGVSMYLPVDSSCALGEHFGPYMWLVLSDAGGTKTLDAFVTRTDMAQICATKDKWQTIDFVNSPNVRWNLRSIDGSLNLQNVSKDSAHGTAVTYLGVGYKTNVVRMNFNGGGPHAWFDQKRVNGMLFIERVQDFTSNALLPDITEFPNGTVPALP
jgi:hypothetical protein